MTLSGFGSKSEVVAGWLHARLDLALVNSHSFVCQLLRTLDCFPDVAVDGHCLQIVSHCDSISAD